MFAHSFRNGILDVRKALRMGVNIGLGTGKDVCLLGMCRYSDCMISGGCRPARLPGQAIRAAELLCYSRVSVQYGDQNFTSN